FSFFFQAEDGIRDYKVTGVQTCALPIWPCPRASTHNGRRPSSGVRPRDAPERAQSADQPQETETARKAQKSRWPVCCRALAPPRSEERRVGKECRSRGWAAD